VRACVCVCLLVSGLRRLERNILVYDARTPINDTPVN